jgi:hypothetical protein
MSTIFPEEDGGDEWASESDGAHTDRGTSKPNGAHISAVLKPDRDVIRKHLELLFGRARTEYPEGLVEIAWSSLDLNKLNCANLFEITVEGLDRAAGHDLVRERPFVGRAGR